MFWETQIDIESNMFLGDKIRQKVQQKLFLKDGCPFVHKSKFWIMNFAWRKTDFSFSWPLGKMLYWLWNHNLRE